jgi:hypothetical protein
MTTEAHEALRARIRGIHSEEYAAEHYDPLIEAAEREAVAAFIRDELPELLAEAIRQDAGGLHLGTRLPAYVTDEMVAKIAELREAAVTPVGMLVPLSQEDIEDAPYIRAVNEAEARHVQAIVSAEEVDWEAMARQLIADEATPEDDVETMVAYQVERFRRKP